MLFTYQYFNIILMVRYLYIFKKVTQYLVILFLESNTEVKFGNSFMSFCGHNSRSEIAIFSVAVAFVLFFIVSAKNWII